MTPTAARPGMRGPAQSRLTAYVAVPSEVPCHGALTATECIATLGSMDESLNRDTNGKRRKRLAERADQMAKSGRLTRQEAERLRSADNPGEFDEVVRNIRVRHAGAKLGAAVEDGSVTREDADGFLDRLRSGEHSAALRSQLRKLRPENRNSARGQSDAPEDTFPT